ncbi:MAG TPA: outer membrane beta-barrel domain-containing protein [Kofleriaceae bacterium]|nr:outer membrane beta-barrel domain-containing protein [Kofleriaceae bacterium]
MAAGTALAQPKGKKAPAKGAPPKTAPAKGSDDAGEIELDDKGGASVGSGAGTPNGAPATGASAGSNDVNPDEIDMGEPEQQQGNLNADLNAANQANAVKAGPVKKTPVSWKDITVVVRKPFLKSRRTELFPFVGATMNDNIIRHYSYGGELAYYLTDVLAVGVEGQGFVHSFREPFDLIARQARRLPTVNQYNWSAALDFHYVPVYGKFAILDHKLITWESFFTAGIGVGQSEVIPRDTKFPGFTNLLIQPNVGVAMRFFLTRWLTVNLGFRDYIFFDHFEPQNRSDTNFATAADAKAHADGSLINNVMFQIGVSFWIPTTFEYTTFR